MWSVTSGQLRSICQRHKQEISTTDMQQVGGLLLYTGCTKCMRGGDIADKDMELHVLGE